MLKICAHICMCGIQKDILFRGKNPFYNSYWRPCHLILNTRVLNNTKWWTLLLSDYNLHFFPSKNWERKDKCCALIIDFRDLLVWEVVCRVELRISYELRRNFCMSPFQFMETRHSHLTTGNAKTIHLLWKKPSVIVTS